MFAFESRNSDKSNSLFQELDLYFDQSACQKKIDHSECRPSVLPPVLGMQNSLTQIDHDIGGVKESSRPKGHKSVSCVWETPLW